MKSYRDFGYFTKIFRNVEILFKNELIVEVNVWNSLIIDQDQRTNMINAFDWCEYRIFQAGITSSILQLNQIFQINSFKDSPLRNQATTDFSFRQFFDVISRIFLLPIIRKQLCRQNHVDFHREGNQSPRQRSLSSR